MLTAQRSVIISCDVQLSDAHNSEDREEDWLEFIVGAHNCQCKTPMELAMLFGWQLVGQSLVCKWCVSAYVHGQLTFDDDDYEGWREQDVKELREWWSKGIAILESSLEIREQRENYEAQVRAEETEKALHEAEVARVVQTIIEEQDFSWHSTYENHFKEWDDRHWLKCSLTEVRDGLKASLDLNADDNFRLYASIGPRDVEATP